MKNLYSVMYSFEIIRKDYYQGRQNDVLQWENMSHRSVIQNSSSGNSTSLWGSKWKILRLEGQCALAEPETVQLIKLI